MRLTAAIFFIAALIACPVPTQADLKDWVPATNGGTNGSITGILYAHSAAFTNTPTVNGVPVVTNAAGSGNMVNTGASVAGMVPVYTSVTGTALTPTNAVSLASVSADTFYLSGLAALVVPVFDASTNMVPSATTTNELNYVHGVTNGIQTQLNAKQASFTTGTGVTNVSNVVSANIAAGSNVSFATNASGSITIAATTGGGGVLSNYTVATLPSAAANTGVQAWCSDNLTPWGTASVVVSDGTSWRGIDSRIAATTSYPQFLLNTYSAGWFGTTPQLISRINDDFNGDATTSSIQDQGFSSVFTSSFMTAGSAAGRSIANVDVTATGSAVVWHASSYFPTAGDYVLFSFTIALPSTLPNGTDNYYTWCGMSSGTATNVGAEFAGFVYDPYKGSTLSASITAATNNWQCATGRGSAYEVTDSGTAASGGTYVTLTGVMNSLTNVVFYINGTSVATNATAAKTPNAAIKMSRFAHVKTLGGGSRQVKYDWSAYVKYLTTTRTFQ